MKITDALGRAEREREQSPPAGASASDPSSADRAAGEAPDPIPARARAAGALGRADVAIPRSREGAWQAHAVLFDPPGPAAAHLRHFALQVRRTLEEREVSSVLVTSALPAEGKTLVACNLALALASMAGGRRIALVDLDLRRPSVATALNVKAGLGLVEVLRGESELRAARLRTDLSALDLYVAGSPVPRAHELLAMPALPELIEALSKDYGTVVIDAPPTLIVPDVELIAPHVGACIAVARAGTTRRASFQEMLALLPREKLIGSFLNESRTPRRAKAYLYYSERGDAEDA